MSNLNNAAWSAPKPLRTDKSALFSALSFCFAGVYRVEGKPEHTEPLNLYSLVIADPAERKSPVMRIVAEPFRVFAAEYNERHKAEFYAAEEQRRQLEQEIERLQKSNESAALIAEKKIKLDRCKRTNRCRIIVDDITPEALPKLLAEHGSLLMLSDEAGMLGNFGGRYNNGVPNLDLLLKCRDGDSYCKDRCGSEAIVLDKPYLSVCLCGQPYILENMMNNTAFLSSGLTARFLYCFPKSLVGTRKYDTEPLNQVLFDYYKDFVYSALKFKLERRGQPEIILRLSEQAKSEYISMYNYSIEPNMRKWFSDCLDWGGKYHGLILRLCGIIHCVSMARSGFRPDDRAVEVSSLQSAARIAGYYAYQALYAYRTGGFDDRISLAEYALNKLTDRRLTHVSGRDLLHFCHKIKSREKLDEITEILVEHGYLRRVKENYCGKGRHPSPVYLVNPNIYGDMCATNPPNQP